MNQPVHLILKVDLQNEMGPKALTLAALFSLVYAMPHNLSTRVGSSSALGL